MPIEFVQPNFCSEPPFILGQSEIGPSSSRLPDLRKSDLRAENLNGANLSPSRGDSDQEKGLESMEAEVVV